MTGKKKRIEFIDIAKGIAIFMVIWGHTATNEELLSPDCGMLYRVLYSVHMPLFFFLSGLSMSDRPLKTWKEWKLFFKKIILSIAIPYFLWALIYCSFSCTNVVHILYGSWQSLGKAASLTSLWYLSCLFIAKILTQAVISFTGRRVWPFAALIMLGAGILLPRFSYGYPWCFDVAFTAGGCILLGVLLKKPLIELSVQRIRVLLLLLAASVGVYTLSALMDKDSFIIMLMCKSQYGTGFGPFIRAISGSFAVILISMILRQAAEVSLSDAQIRPLIYIGQYTMGIFLLHKPFMQQAAIPFMTAVAGNLLSEGIIRFITSLGVMLLCLPVCNVIMHYIPELIGINRN